MHHRSYRRYAAGLRSVKPPIKIYSLTLGDADCVLKLRNIELFNIQSLFADSLAIYGKFESRKLLFF